MGPLASSLAIQPLVEKIYQEVPNLLFNVRYLDDGILCGNPDYLTKAFQIIEEFGPSIGLKLNLSKCLLYLPSSSDISNLFPSTIPISFEGLMLLGSRIGSPDYRASAIQERVEKVKAILCSYRIHSMSPLF